MNRNISVVFWLNSPSPHQRPFLTKLNEQKNVALKACYFGEINSERKSQGWNNSNLNEFEQYVDIVDIPKYTVNPNTIHIIPGVNAHFTKSLVAHAVKNKLKWVHWSERFGVVLARKLNFNVHLMKLLRGLYLKSKKSYGRTIKTSALGALSIGELARKDFLEIGISSNQIGNLFYSIPALQASDKVQTIENICGDKRVFLCTSQLCVRKGVDILLKSFAKLKSDRWILVIVGKDQANGLYQKLARKLGVEDSVLFTGVIPIEKMGDYMNYADVFVLPTRFDGWGVVLNEAASLSKALISTDECGAAHHLIHEGENGYKVKGDNVRVLKKAMEHYVENEDLIEKHGFYSKQLFEKEFTPSKNVDRFLNTINKWLNKI